MLDFNQIREILPQASPLLMVDRVLECEEGKSIKALKNISGNELTFLGHFPRFALMPGVLMLEGLGQCAILLYHLTYGALPAEDMPLFGAVEAKFHRPVFPGDQLIMQVASIKMTSFGGIFEGTASVEGQTVVRCQLSMGRKSRRNLRNEGTEEPEGIEEKAEALSVVS